MDEKNSDIELEIERPSFLSNNSSEIENANRKSSSSSDDFYDSDEHKLMIEFIKNAKEFGVNALDLSKRNLVTLPKEIFDMNNLQV
jgi:hypothetical protein